MSQLKVKLPKKIGLEIVRRAKYIQELIGYVTLLQKKIVNEKDNEKKLTLQDNLARIQAILREEKKAIKSLINSIPN
jgi:hypothetical protein